MRVEGFHTLTMKRAGARRATRGKAHGQGDRNSGTIKVSGRLVDNLRSQRIKRLVVVTGYLDNCVREFLDRYAADMQVDYVFNPVYQTTNNIYSLWLARQAIQEQQRNIVPPLTPMTPISPTSDFTHKY